MVASEAVVRPFHPVSIASSSANCGTPRCVFVLDDFGWGFWMCQKKKAKQKHRNSASVTGQPDHSSGLERSKLGFCEGSIVRFRLPSSN